MLRITVHRACTLAMLVFSLAACQDTTPEVFAPGAVADLAGAPNPNARGKGGGKANAQIAFSVPGVGIHAVNPDGSGHTAIANTADGTDPAWSSDRKKIAFTIPTGSSAGLYVINANGRQRFRLYAGVAGAPAWSPDGTKIAFHAAVTGGTHLLVIDANGSNLQQATAVGTVNNHPTWSGDGRKIAFFSNRSPGPGLWVMNSNGTQRVRIRSCSDCSAPTWSPVRAISASPTASLTVARSIMPASASSTRTAPYRTRDRIRSCTRSRTARAS